MNPSLYGIYRSNRDFNQPSAWGKNQFNSSFPASLACYMELKGEKPVYYTLDTHLNIRKEYIETKTLYGASYMDDELFFAFESAYSPYNQLVIGKLPRIDLVTQDCLTSKCLRGLEIKLTALSDNSTCNFDNSEFGTELVIRPDTIVYLACSIVMQFKDSITKLREIIGRNFEELNNWSNPKDVIELVPQMVERINAIFINNISAQQPIVLQPIWRTKGKSPILDEKCLDVFVWSNYAFSKLFLDVGAKPVNSISRPVRTIIWLFKMIYEFALNGQFDHKRIIDELSYNTKNDKAFAFSGIMTRKYMKCVELSSPRINSNEIKNIILGNGQKLLSPERDLIQLFIILRIYFNEE